MCVVELLVSGYIRDTVQEEFDFSLYVSSNQIKNTILMFLPKPKKMNIVVSLAHCSVLPHSTHKMKYTMYSFELNIMDEICHFSARYSSLYRFHLSLLEDINIRASFGSNVPIFPGKQWWKDFTKKANYTKRAAKLLQYLRQMVQNHYVWKSNIFQNGIFLPKYLRDILSNTIREYYWPPFHEVTSSLSHHSQSTTKISLKHALENLAMQTEESFISVYSDGSFIPFHNSYECLHNMYLFQMEDIVPMHLIMDHDKTQQQPETHSCIHGCINPKLFETLNIEDERRINNIASDIKYALLDACDIAVL